jgi:hypothetical protein
MNDFKHISNLVAEQFPDFYKSEGPDFVQFVKAYYEWDENRSKTRELMDIRDIDTTPDDMIDHFKTEYMNEIPSQILGDKRLLQKHILDLYRSKGSIEGIKLIFRLLYNTEIEYYIPAEDIFKPDASEWFEPKYLEVSKFPTNFRFIDKNITGKTSGAKAIVENYERRNLPGHLVDLMFVSNIKGSFLPGEQITFDDIDIPEPTILGSVESVKIVSSTPGFKVGDIAHSSNNQGVYLDVIATQVANGGQGIIEFNLEDGGQGYTLNSTITVTAGTNSTGNGAMFKITELANTFVANIGSLTFAYWANVAFNASSYGGAFGTANSGNIFSSTVTGSTPVTYGKIAKIATTNPGNNYDGTVTVHVFEPTIQQLYFQDANGNYYGNNAVITSDAIYGNGLMQAAKVLNSGYGYYIQGEIVPVSINNDAHSTAFAELKLGGVGRAAGYWRDSASFTDSDKYLQDDFYYQEYSYELILRKKLSEYYDVLKKTVHPSGNAMFGKIRIITGS